MKTFLAVFTVCFLTACPKKTPPPGAAQVLPRSEREFRLLFTYPPYSPEQPQIRNITKAGQAALARVRDRLVETAKPENPSAEVNPPHGSETSSGGRVIISRPWKSSVYVYHLEGADGGTWQALGLVDGLGRFVAMEPDGQRVKEAPRFTDARATLVLREQIEMMALERTEVGEPTEQEGPTKPLEGVRIEGKPGYMRSPYDPQGRPIDVRGLPKRTEVEDPYNQGKTLYVP